MCNIAYINNPNIIIKLIWQNTHSRIIGMNECRVGPCFLYFLSDARMPVRPHPTPRRSHEPTPVTNWWYFTHNLRAQIRQGNCKNGGVIYLCWGRRGLKNKIKPLEFVSQVSENSLLFSFCSILVWKTFIGDYIYYELVSSGHSFFVNTLVIKKIEFASREHPFNLFNACN